MAQYGYTKNFSSIMDMAGLLTSEQFSTFIEDIVAPNTTDKRDTTGFEQLPLKAAYNMTYAALMLENNIGIMANHVALDAHARPTPTEGFSALAGSIPHVATNETLGKEDYLKAAKILRDAEEGGQSLQLAARIMLQKMISAKLVEHANRASYMRDYVVFNGKYDITAQNNIGSFSEITFDFKVPVANKKVLTGDRRWWTNDDYTEEGSAATPIADIDDILLDLEDHNIPRSNIVIEIGLRTLNRLARHTKVRADIALYLNSMLAGHTTEEMASTTSAMSDNQLVDALSERLGVKFLVRNFMASLPKPNVKTGKWDRVTMVGYSEDKLVFRPVGKIGEIHSVGHIIVGGDEGSNGRYALHDEGRILLTYTCNVRERVQIWDTEETSLYVPTAGKLMRYLTVK